MQVLIEVFERSLWKNQLLRAGPALEQVRGSIGSTFAGPHSVACAKIFDRASSHNDRNRWWDRARSCAWLAQFHLSSRDFSAQRRNTQ